MKKIINIAILLIILSSCNQNKVSDLNNQIMELKKQNKELKDSISQLELKTFYSFHIIGRTDKNSFKVNEEVMIDFDFGYKNYIKNYDVYRVKANDENDRELVLKDQKLSKFKYSFTPKNKKDDRVNLMVEFDLDSMTIVVPAEITLNITE